MAPALRKRLAPFCLLAALFVAGLPGIRRTVFDYDEGAYLACARAAARGAAPYRDRMYAHPPLMAVVDATLWREGLGVGGIRAVHWAIAVACAGVAYTLTRASGGSKAAAVCALFCTAGTALWFRYGRIASLEPFAALPVLCALYLWLFTDTPRARLVAGALLALACLVKLAAVVPALALCLAEPVRQRSLRGTTKSLAPVAMGFIAVALPAFALCTAIPRFCAAVFTYQMSRARFPLATRFALLDIPSLVSWFDAAVIAGGLCASVALLFSRKAPRRSLGVVNLVGVALTFFAPATFYAHYLLLYMPTCAAALCLVADEPAGALPWPRAKRAFAFLLMAAWTARLVAVAAPGPAERQVVASLRASRGRIFTNAPLLALMADRPLADWYYATDPFAAGVRNLPPEEWTAALAGCDEAVLVTGHLGIPPAEAMVPVSVRKYIKEEFDLTEEWPHFRLWRRAHSEGEASSAAAASRSLPGL